HVPALWLGAFPPRRSSERQRWQGEGWIERLDRVHSRDGHAQRYVQHALAAKSEVLRAWADDNAAIYVCGSLQGMAPAVDAVLREDRKSTRLNSSHVKISYA